MRASQSKLGLAITLIVSIEACGGSSSSPTSPATTPATTTAPFAWTQPSIPSGLSASLTAMLLDVCQLIGFDTMQKAYRAIYPLRPPYRAVLSQNVINTFVAAVPVSLQAAVRAKLNSVGY